MGALVLRAKASLFLTFLVPSGLIWFPGRARFDDSPRIVSVLQAFLCSCFDAGVVSRGWCVWVAGICCQTLERTHWLYIKLKKNGMPMLQLNGIKRLAL